MLRRLRIENLVLIREADLELGGGLNVLSGETGAGKTIFAQAIGLLLGVKGDAAAVGPAASEAYVEAELDVPDGFFDDAETASLAELRPEDEAGLVLARRVFADGRTRAYAWGRSIAREDLAAATERLIAMSGQFQQRRLARPSYQLDVLDSSRATLRCSVGGTRGAPGGDSRRHAGTATRSPGMPSRRRRASRRCATSSSGARDWSTGKKRHCGPSGSGCAMRQTSQRAPCAATAAVAPDEGEGAAALAAAAERALAPLTSLAPELELTVSELRELTVRLSEVGSDLHRFVASLEADPARMEAVEARLDLIAELRRRFAAGSLEELLERRVAAVAELEALEGGLDPLTAAEDRLTRAEEQYNAVAGALRETRTAAAAPFAASVRESLEGVGMGEGEFSVELREREPGPSGRDEAVFLIRPNPGLPFGPVADTASGGELSRVALALAVVAGGETLVFDEIDAGIGGVTAHRVAETLARLAERAQVVTITHLPQIANVAERHFRVEKVPGDPTHTQIEELSADERRAELERMLGGEEFLTAIAASESRR